MNQKQEAILVHKIEVVCNLMQLYIKEQQKPKAQAPLPKPKPSTGYDPNLNRIDMKLILRCLEKSRVEEAKSQDAQLERIAKLTEELARWQRFLALNPPKPETVFVTPSPPPELIKKIEAYIAKAEAFIRQHQGDLPTIEEFQAIDEAVRETTQNKEKETE